MEKQRGRKAVVIELDEEERQTLERWIRRRSTAQGLAMRSRIVLGAAEGRTNVDIAAEVGCSGVTVSKWRNRFARRRLDGLYDNPRPGPPRRIDDAKVEEVVVKTLEETPRDATHWSTRSMARAVGLSQSSILRIWRAFGLKPHRTEHFKISPDPQFVEKVRDLAGLYLNPPDAAVVLCVDHKSQIQALDRTAPILPLLPGTPQRRTHDYRRYGTTNLGAALDTATGRVITSMTRRNRTHRIPDVPKPHQPRSPTRTRRPCRVGQRVAPQNRTHRALAATPSTVHVPFHTHLRVVDEPRRAMVLRTHHQTDTPRHPPIRSRTHRRHQPMDPTLEPKPQTLHLAQNRRPNLRQPHQLSTTNPRIRTLGEC